MPPTVYPLVVAIRDNLTHENLVTASVNPEDVLEFPNITWVEFDFEDIMVTVNETYYIVAYTNNGEEQQPDNDPQKIFPYYVRHKEHDDDKRDAEPPVALLLIFFEKLFSKLSFACGLQRSPPV